jgi:hypothetical protein
VASFTITQSNNKNYLLGVEDSTFSSSNVHYSTDVWYQSGKLFSSSDERLKIFHDDIAVDFDALAKIPKKYFNWKDNPDDVEEIGTSAQAMANVYPEVVSIDGNGYYGVSYERLSIIALAAIDKLHKENEELTERIDELERLIKQ